MTGNETAPQIWHYAAGKWTQAPDPLEWDEHNQTWPGFTRSAAMGFAIPEVEIYESTDGDRWRLGVCLDGCTIRYIEVASLPDAIDVLSKLAPITTAYLLSGVSEQLESLIFNAGEDADRERNRRRTRKRNP